MVNTNQLLNIKNLNLTQIEKSNLTKNVQKRSSERGILGDYFHFDLVLVNPSALKCKDQLRDLVRDEIKLFKGKNLGNEKVAIARILIRCHL